MAQEKHQELDPVLGLPADQAAALIKDAAEACFSVRDHERLEYERLLVRGRRWASMALLRACLQKGRKDKRSDAAAPEPQSFDDADRENAAYAALMLWRWKWDYLREMMGRLGGNTCTQLSYCLLKGNTHTKLAAAILMADASLPPDEVTEAVRWHLASRRSHLSETVLVTLGIALYRTGDERATAAVRNQAAKSNQLPEEYADTVLAQALSVLYLSL